MGEPTTPQEAKPSVITYVLAGFDHNGALNDSVERLAS
jgi:hypothetical protein